LTITSVTDPVGIVSAFSYDNGDFIKALTTPYGKTTFAYTGNGVSRMLIITDPYGETERIEFGQSLGIPGSVPDRPTGDILTRNAYHNYRNTAYWNKQTYKDYGRNINKAELSHWLHMPDNKTSGLLETFKKPLENRVWFNHPGQTSAIYATNIYQETHSRLGRVLDDGSSQIFIRQFNKYGNKTYDQTPLGHYLKYQYADNQIDLLQIIRLRDGVEETIAEYTWDDQHNLLSATDGQGNTTTYTYNVAGQVLTQINALKHITQYDYDEQGYLQRITYPTGKVEEYSYDEVGRVASFTDSEGHTRTHTYDALNRPLRISYEDGTYFEYTWDKLDLIRLRDRLGRETHFTYDALRRKISEKDHLGRETRYSYDASDRLLSVTDALGNVTRYEYDIQGRKTATIDPEGHRTRYVYENSSSRLSQIIDAQQGVTDLTYDRANRLVAVTDPNRHTTRYLLDEAGNTLQQISPDSGVTVYSYNPIGNPIQQTNARGVVSNYDYDALNRLQHIHYQESAYDIVMNYDGDNYPTDIPDTQRQAAIGLRTGMVDNSGETHWYYNVFGDIEQIDTFFSDLGNTAFSQLFSYDYSYEPGAGLLTRHLYPNGQFFDYQYDGYGRVKSIYTEMGGKSRPVISDAAYHAVASDGIAKYVYGNGLSYQRQVDELGRLTELNVQGKQNIFHRQWQYTPSYNIAEINNLLDPAQSQSYRYDPLQRLIEATTPTLYRYEYDANSNRLSENSRLYAVDSDSNRLFSVGDANESLTLLHDDNGNRVAQIDAKGHNVNYEYDPQNRLSTIFNQNGELASYQYNGIGQRVIKHTAKGTEYGLYNPQGQRISLFHRDNGEQHNTFYWNGRPLAHYRSSDSYHFVSRHKHRKASLVIDPVSKLSTPIQN
jgi:YD repeat-containing protein